MSNIQHKVVGILYCYKMRTNIDTYLQGTTLYYYDFTTLVYVNLKKYYVCWTRLFHFYVKTKVMEVSQILLKKTGVIMQLATGSLSN